MRGVTGSAGIHTAACKFLLTRLMRGVTEMAGLVLLARKFLLTRLMRGVTLLIHWYYTTTNDFYSHASCEA